MLNHYTLEKIAWYTQQERLAEAQQIRLARALAGSTERRGFVATVVAAFRAGQLGPAAETPFQSKLTDLPATH